MFAQLLLVGGPWFYEESGIFLSNPDPVDQNVNVIGSQI